MTVSPHDRDDVSQLWGGAGGFVTLEWMMIAAAAILMAIGAITVLKGHATTAANAVGTNLVSSISTNA